MTDRFIRPNEGINEISEALLGFMICGPPEGPSTNTTFWINLSTSDGSPIRQKIDLIRAAYDEAAKRYNAKRFSGTPALPQVRTTQSYFGQPATHLVDWAFNPDKGVGAAYIQPAPNGSGDSLQLSIKYSLVYDE